MLYLIKVAFITAILFESQLLDNIDIHEHTDKQANPDLDLDAFKRGSIKVKARAGLSVCVLANVDFIFQLEVCPTLGLHAFWLFANYILVFSIGFFTITIA